MVICLQWRSDSFGFGGTPWEVSVPTPVAFAPLRMAKSHAMEMQVGFDHLSCPVLPSEKFGNFKCQKLQFGAYLYLTL